MHHRAAFAKGAAAAEAGHGGEQRHRAAREAREALAARRGVAEGRAGAAFHEVPAPVVHRVVVDDTVGRVE